MPPVEFLPHKNVREENESLRSIRLREHLADRMVALCSKPLVAYSQHMSSCCWSHRRFENRLSIIAHKRPILVGATITLVDSAATLPYPRGVKKLMDARRSMESITTWGADK